MDHGRSTEGSANPLLRKLLRAILLTVLVVAAAGCWAAHLQAWNTGPRRPILSFDAAQYALAAHELAEHGRLATPFALPIDLARRAQPPWPLSVVQPGMVLTEAALFKVAPDSLTVPGFGTLSFASPEKREWLVLVLPVVSFIVLALGFALAAMRLVHVPGGGGPVAAAFAGIVVAAAFMLDPEAQHFATGGFTELPFTLGLFLAVAHLATGGAARRPLLFGLLLGVTGLFRGNMLWLAPLFALMAAWSGPDGNRIPGRRSSIAIHILLGFALPLAPWWFYKWQTFGSPMWDLSGFALWDGIGGRTWFSLLHLPQVPDVPTGAAGLSLIAGKVVRNMSSLALTLVSGPRGLWLGALFIWLVTARDAGLRPLRAAGITVIAALVLNMLVAAAGIPLSRYVFPVRALLEVAGILALWNLVLRAPQNAMGPALRIAVAIIIGALAVGWGTFQHIQGLEEARAAAARRGIPSSLAMEGIVSLIDAELETGEPIMSNLGPTLAWYTPRPVVHLALGPEDVDECRRRYDVRHVLLVFRSAELAWHGWDQIVARPAEAPDNSDWNFRSVKQYNSVDGFIIVWLETGPLEPGLAGPGSAPLHSIDELAASVAR